MCCSLTACSPGSDSLTHHCESQHGPFEITNGQQHTGFEDESVLRSDLIAIHNFISEQLEAELICVYNAGYSLDDQTIMEVIYYS